MTEEMDCEDNSEIETADTFIKVDDAGPETFKSDPENIILVPNALDPETMVLHHLAFDAESKTLAVFKYARKVRSEEGSKSSIKGPVGKIEIWGTSPLYRLKQSIFLPGEFSSNEGLAWYKGRLFSCGIHGHLVEYDIEAEKIKKWTPVPGGIKWCLAIDQATGRIAVGSEDGFVIIMQIYDYEIELEKILDRQEDRVLCISWSPDGKKLVTGSPNAVRIWDVKSGQAVDRITIGKVVAKDDTIVWCTAFLDDSTFATGDSKGRVCIWDAKMGVCSETHETKLQQVQCLATAKNKIYCAGVGKQIQVLLKGKEEFSNKWVVGATRTIHTHDVRALAAITDSELVSGGVDSYLVVSRAPPITVNVIPPYRSSDVQISSQKRLFMIRYISSTAVLHLPEDSFSANMLLRFNTSSPITTIGLSEDGNWCALSTVKNAKMFALNCFSSNAKASAELVLLPSNEYKSFKRIQFSQNPGNMAAVFTKNNKIRILALSYEFKAVTETHVVNLEQVLPTYCTINLMAFTDNRLIVSDFEGNVAFSSQKNDCSKSQDWTLLPKHTHEVTALTVNPENRNKVILIYADGQISEFAMEGFSYKILKAKEESNEESSRCAPGSSLTTVCCHNSSDGLFMSVDGGKLIGFNYFNMLLQKHGKGNALYPSVIETNFGKFLVNMAQFANGDICIVRASHERLLEKLPPMPAAKSYGTHLL
ncbi:U3 small nucleolar RNA-associated protein 4 homolog isoform X1 [Cloeon dipterum]|uniref:U3 small nucleolar RNA-associated protein 4 homolog isoform X1 n=2 Tax=Cloeon dipterum TaxID=197152 RepID=UPI0032206C33